MKDILKKEALFLHYIVTLKEKDIKSILKTSNRSQINAISGIVFNVIRKTLELKPSVVKELKPYKKSLYLIADKKTSLNRKRNLIARRVKQILLILNSAIKWIPIK